MKSIDPKNLKKILETKKTKTYSLTKVDINNLAIFFCNTEDLYEVGYVAAEKRDFL
jgi:hypothetical protein